MVIAATYISAFQVSALHNNRKLQTDLPSVIDSGPGLAKEDVSLLFKRFSQASKQSNKVFGGMPLVEVTIGFSISAEPL
jgi:K+-sensing histidine kinase KdpD